MTDNSITPFLFEGEALVRVISQEGDPWFVGADVCRILGVKDHTQALERLDADERGRYSIPTPGGMQEVIVISEPGMYRLTFSSRKPVAERLKRWLSHEVLPSIRKTGRYDGAATIIPPAEPRDEVRDTASNRQLVTEARQTWGVKSAQQMWIKLGLPVVPAMFEPQAQASLFDMSAAEPRP